MTRLQASPDVAATLNEPSWHFMVTGGGGWLGRAALEMLDDVYGPGLESRVAVFGGSAKALTLRSGRRIVSRPFAEMGTLQRTRPVILHFAYLTRGYAAQMPTDDYVAMNRSLSATVKEAAGRLGARGVFVPSSGAVYRRDRTLDRDFAANPYGALKVEDEERFTVAAERYGFPAVIFRIFNLSGPFMNYPGHYALGSILLDITAGRAVEIRAAHPVIRSYLHVGDVLSLALDCLVRGEAAGPLDASGRTAVEIGDLARRSARLLGRSDLDVRRPAFESGEPDEYVGDDAAFEAMAQAAGIALRSLDEQIMETAAFLREAS